MTHMQDGHEHEGRNAVLVLNTPLLKDLDPGQERSLVDALVAVSGNDDSVSTLVERLGAHLAQIGAPQPPTVVERMVENLRGAHDVTIATDDGRVLHGDPSWSPSTVDPDVDDTEDPAHPERPTWS